MLSNDEKDRRETSKRKSKNGIHEQHHQKNGRVMDSMQSAAGIKGRKDLD